MPVRAASPPALRGRWGRAANPLTATARRATLARPSKEPIMSIERFDAIVVGAGQAGPALAARCAKEGLRTAVIERDRFGGTCVNVGCVPTKTLVGSNTCDVMFARSTNGGASWSGPLR